jgi:DNA-binding HxlR family transcriptional regulator
MVAASNLISKEECIMDEQEKKQAVYVAKALTNGGRALNAVWRCDKVDAQEKLILLYLGSQLDFRGDFTEAVQRHISTIVKWTGIKRTTVFDRLKSLEEKKYIERKNKTLANGAPGANEYYLTDLIFTEHYALLAAEAVRDADDPRSPDELPSSVSRTTPVRQTNYPRSPDEHFIPSSSSLSSNPSFSSDGGEKKKKKTPTPRKSYEHIGIVQSMDWLFKKTKNGGYEFEVANTWMQKLVRDRGEQACWNMSEWFGKKVEKFRETCRGAWVVSPASLELLIAFYDSHRDNMSQSDNCSPVNSRQDPKPDWGLMKRQAQEDREANGSLDSFPF